MAAWRSENGTRLAMDTYQPTYTVTAPDGESQGFYTLRAVAQSPFVRRALARELPAADMTGHKAVVL